MEHVDSRFRRRAWKAHQRPAGVSGGMRRLGDAFEALGDVRRIAAERDDLERLAERDERANQLRRIAADAGGGRTEATAIETDTQDGTVIQNAKCKMQTRRSVDPRG